MLTLTSHSHVHETIQPVIQKEIIQPEVVHTTVPVHEVHHQSAQHHGTTHLPAVSLDEFKKQGGVLSGNQERRSEFEGCPEGVHNESNNYGSDHKHTHGSHTGSHTGTGLNQSSTGTSGSHIPGEGRDRLNQSSTTGTGSHHITGEGREGSGRGLEGAVGGHNNTTGTRTGTHDTTTDTQKKPSLLDRLNPMKDTDHDGKKGMMD